MLRDVGNINKRTPPKVEQPEITKPIIPFKYIPSANHEVLAAKPVTVSVQRMKLEPGKIYTKEELEKYFSNWLQVKYHCFFMFLNDYFLKSI